MKLPGIIVAFTVPAIVFTIGLMVSGLQHPF